MQRGPDYLPAQVPLPQNRVEWPILSEQVALLIHDMQPHYLAALGPSARAQILSSVKQLIAACLERNIPIFASCVPSMTHRDERGLMLDMWGAGPSSAGVGVAGELGLCPMSYKLLTKRSYSAFYGTDFEILLRRLGRRTIIVTGIYASIGCYLTAADAFMRDIKVFIVSDAVGDFSFEDHRAGLYRAASTCGRVLTAEAVLRAITKGSV